MPTKRGLFIVLEGLDGAGTTTQSRLLVEALLSRGLGAVLTREPTDEPVGRLIRKALTGELESPASGGKVTLSEEALCLLFAADRIEHSRWIVEATRSSGRQVVSDRYVLSSIAYQSLDPRITPERVIEVNRGCAVPDVTFFLDVSVDECLRRLEGRPDSRTVYEKKPTLQRIAANYRATLPLYEKHFGRVVVIDGSRAVSEVHGAIAAGLRDLLA